MEMAIPSCAIVFLASEVPPLSNSPSFSQPISPDSLLQRVAMLHKLPTYYPAFASGVSHIEPGGLSFRDVLNILQNLQGDFVAGDVVEFNPQRDTVDGMTAMVSAKLMRELAAKISK